MKKFTLNLKTTLIIILFGMINLISLNTYAVLSVSITTISNVTCWGGSDGQAAAHPIGGVIPYTYHWSDGETTDTAVYLYSGNFTVTVTDATFATATATVTITQPNQFIPVITPSGPITFCVGDNVTLTATAGTSYLWSTGAITQSITVNTSGNYNVTVTNGSGCSGTTASTVITVNPLPTPSITAGGPTSFCQGGSVTLTSTYASSYLWSDNETTQSIIVTTSGSWTVTVTDANGCNGTSAGFTTIVNPAPTPTITPSGSITICNSQSVTLTSSYGLTYLWSTGATTQSISVNTAGTFWVTISDVNGCSGNSDTVNVAIINNAPPAPGLITGSIYDVQGYYYTYSVAPVTGATAYVWTMPSGWAGTSTTNSINLFPGASSGNICVVAVNACGNSTPSCLHVNIVNCNTSFILYPDTTQLHHYFVTDTIYGVAPFHYDWSWGDLTTDDTIAYPSHTYADSGIYTICLTITDSTGCQSTFCDSNYHIMRTANYMVYVNVIHSNTVGINQPELNNSISLYPNPTTGNFSLSYFIYDNSKSEFQLMDIAGRIIFTDDITGVSGMKSINVSELNNGIYFWKMISGNSILDKGKIVLMK